MLEKEVVVTNHAGIHARPSALLVKMASRFDAEVFLSCEGTEVNAKSIMSVMMLAAALGSVVKIRTEGADEVEALRAIEALFASKFNED
ncbi:MAG: HPr family phosphocarrier protein [Bacteroidetes bacterium]|nr:HPr family phosphocarrier protein [Bacteroidota bacterium]